MRSRRRGRVFILPRYRFVLKNLHRFDHQSSMYCVMTRCNNETVDESCPVKLVREIQYFRENIKSSPKNVFYYS